MSKYLSCFTLFFYLGCISFGGPTAHITLFQHELIEKRKWLNINQYMQILAVCQFLPGPTSSQVGMALGFSKYGYWGAGLAWLGFTLPSALMLYSIAFGMMQFDFIAQEQLLKGLKIAATAIVASAVYSMMQQICTAWQHYVWMLFTASLYGYLAKDFGQWIWILLGGIIGVVCFKSENKKYEILQFKVSKKVGYSCLITFFSVFLILTALASNNIYYHIAYIFYQAGALVFGGGHVVLPLLETEIVGTSLLTQDHFVAGYGIVQSMPGPLFNFATYLGAVLLPSQPLGGALLATVMIFLPAALILFGILPFMKQINHLNWLQSALIGVNVTVVGVLLATFFDPILISSLNGWFDLFIILILFNIFYFKKLPVWMVIGISCVTYSLF